MQCTAGKGRQSPPKAKAVCRPLVGGALRITRLSRKSQTTGNGRPANQSAADIALSATAVHPPGTWRYNVEALHPICRAISAAVMVPDAIFAFAAVTLMASNAGPPIRPRARLAARAVRVRSRRSSTSNCPRAAKMWRISRLVALVASMLSCNDRRRDATRRQRRRLRVQPSSDAVPSATHWADNVSNRHYFYGVSFLSSFVGGIGAGPISPEIVHDLHGCGARGWAARYHGMPISTISASGSSHTPRGHGSHSPARRRPASLDVAAQRSSHACCRGALTDQQELSR
jgi:hypothetical protein